MKEEKCVCLQCGKLFNLFDMTMAMSEMGVCHKCFEKYIKKRKLKGIKK